MSNFKTELDSIQKEYYTENGKNSFFKNKQKIECAKKICSKYSLKELISNTIFQIKNTNKVFIDYTIFKLYINPDNYEIFIHSVFDLFSEVLTSYKTYEVHINLDTFTATSADRYKNIIKLYNEESDKYGTHFINNLSFMKLYNLPSLLEMMSSIMKPIINPHAYQKFILVSKEESANELNKLISDKIDI